MQYTTLKYFSGDKMIGFYVWTTIKYLLYLSAIQIQTTLPMTHTKNNHTYPPTTFTLGHSPTSPTHATKPTHRVHPTRLTPQVCWHTSSGQFMHQSSLQVTDVSVGCVHYAHLWHKKHTLKLNSQNVIFSCGFLHDIWLDPLFHMELLWAKNCSFWYP